MDRFIVMGASGCGKSTVASALAEELHGLFIDADDLHPRSNVEKMRAGRALCDADRFPWLDLVGRRLGEGPKPTVIACSALKRRYRKRIALSCAPLVTFIYLHGSRDVLWKRMSNRPGHFMPPALLDSQLAALEPPSQDEHAITVDIDQHPRQVVLACLAGLREYA